MNCARRDVSWFLGLQGRRHVKKERSLYPWLEIPTWKLMPSLALHKCRCTSVLEPVDVQRMINSCWMRQALLRDARVQTT
jgi:hypothetical protein